MAEQFFDVMKWHSTFSPSRSGFVAEVMEVQIDLSHAAPARLAEPAFRPHRFTSGRFEQCRVPRVLERGHGSTHFVAEHERISRKVMAMRIESCEVQHRREARRDGHETVLTVLGRFRPHPEFASVKIYVLPSQRQEFAEPATGLERCHDQPIDPGRRGVQQS